MNSTTHRLEILYCPKCKVGMDAVLSKQVACPRCGGRRQRVRGVERWMPAKIGNSLAEELFLRSAQQASERSVTRDLVQNALSQIIHS